MVTALLGAAAAAIAACSSQPPISKHLVVNPPDVAFHTGARPCQIGAGDDCLSMSSELPHLCLAAQDNCAVTGTVQPLNLVDR
jgi:hypothetical protein